MSNFSVVSSHQHQQSFFSFSFESFFFSLFDNSLSGDHCLDHLSHYQHLRFTILKLSFFLNTDFWSFQIQLRHRLKRSGRVSLTRPSPVSLNSFHHHLWKRERGAQILLENKWINVYCLTHRRSLLVFFLAKRSKEMFFWRMVLRIEIEFGRFEYVQKLRWHKYWNAMLICD